MTTPIITDRSPRQVLSARDASRSVAWRVLLKCASPPEPSDPGDLGSIHTLDWQGLLQVAEKQGLIPLLAEHLKKLDPSRIPQDICAKLAEARRFHAVFALQLTAELFRVLQLLADAGITTLVTKGPALSFRCYGDPGMRQYGDIDLIVREIDIRRVTLAMLQQGYQPRVPLSAIDAGKTPGEYVFRKPGTDLLMEFHTERTFRYHPRPLQIEKLFERSTSLTIDKRAVPVLSLEDELVLICVHGAKHFWERLMWVADVAALISRQSLDWERAAAVAREVGAQRILCLGLRLASDLLRANPPPALEPGVRSDSAVASLAAQIEERLASAHPRDISLWQRAAFRVRIREGLLRGLAYLLRLSLSPTEDDWTPGRSGNRSALVEALGRPLRLAKKHRRRSE